MQINGSIKIKNAVFLLLFCSFSLFSQVNVEKWKVFELALDGPTNGNPFKEVQLSAQFINGSHTISVPGFYDGNGVYKLRFMPQQGGKWNYTTSSNAKKLDNKQGHFMCTPASDNNHGPVAVTDTFYFAYADGTPHHSFGTTCYAWVHQGDSLAELTLGTLSKGYFNKMRMCIFPKSYNWNKNEPLYYPFEGTPLKNWDYSRLNPVYFQNIEKRIMQLDSLGIEADLIVFHPYDRWGFSSFDRETEDMYIEYIIARFAAFKNVWWSMANEYDFMRSKQLSDWDYYIEQFGKKDPFHHLIGIHNGVKVYDHTNPTITHASIQNEDTFRAKELRMKYKKPVIYDECRYEGNIPWSWGNLTGQALTEKFWRGVTNGGYVGHGDTYVTEELIQFPNESSDVLWWSKGGELRGQSPERIKFLRRILEDAPAQMKPIPLFTWMPFSCIGIEHEYYLGYLNDAQPRSIVIDLPKDASYQVEVIDTWDMTITPLQKKFSGKSLIELPEKPYMAIRIIKQD
ncbi:DUF5060 domain-containing protein [candidate division KSB1 bacterium]|nr:DUF5060 domain-containing protein [candidate division KSB1 bacterium]RQW06336.1 MAG: DUF5060 domain-containing protein [candidate division KSB1 bacterium]